MGIIPGFLKDRLHALINWIKAKTSKKQFIFFSSILVGLSAGFAAVILKTFVHAIYKFATSDTLGAYQISYLALPFIGILLTVIVVNRVLGGKIEKGLSHIHRAIIKEQSRVPKEQTYAQIATSSLTVGLGGSTGLEAPMVITGAALGSNYAQTYNLSEKDRTMLLACGVAAGIAAAFNAPIAGVLFAVEVMLADISIAALTPVIIAAASGALVSMIILHNDIVLYIHQQQPFNYLNVPYYIVLGGLCGLLAVFYSKTFIRVETSISKSSLHPFVKIVIGGLLLAILILLFPSLFGEGYDSIKTLSQQQPEVLFQHSIIAGIVKNQWILLAMIGLCMLLKIVAAAATIGSGGNGGVFAPSLFGGAYLGFLFSESISSTPLTSLPTSNFTLVGMAGVLSGVYHAPLTAIFLIAEITGGYTLMIPLMIVSSISFLISKYLEPHSMDTRNLRTGKAEEE